MQAISANLLSVLQSSERDLVDLYEFYDPTQTDLTPGHAAARFCETTVEWSGYAYSQYTISRGDVSRYVDGRFNTVTLTLSNVDRVAGGFADTGIEGYRLVIRTISRRVDEESLVLFVGRVEKPFEVDQTTVQINVKQDLGSIENDLPWRTFAPKCQVAGGFKELECLAGESLGSKSAPYQAATVCNFSFAQCTEYVNTPAFQAFRFNGKKGNFKVSQRRGGAGGAILGLFGLGNKRVTKQWSNQDDVPYGKPIPLGFGRTQIELTPIQHADTGEFIAGQSVVGEGELTALVNVRNVTAGFAFTFQAYAQHVGKFGTDASQTPTGFFASAGDRHSHTSYVEYTIKGDNPDTGDSAPTLVAVALWLKIPRWDGSAFTGSDWSDVGPEILRQLLVEPRSLNYNAAWIDAASFGAAVDVCNQPLSDTSGGEDFYVSTASGTAGTDFKRYRSTGLLDTFHFRKILGLDSTYAAERETTYNTFSAAAPPASITPSTHFRRRYTCNFHLKEKVKAADFIFKTLLPSFRGYLTTSASGKLQLRIEQPPPTSLLRSNASAGATALEIEDAKLWKTQSLSIYHALVGVGLSDSETVRVTSIDYSTDGNSITLSAGATGGGITATASGGTLTGGSITVQSSGTVTMGGTPAAGNTVTITIDGVAIGPYTLNASDTTGTVAGIMAARVNANTTLNRFIEAIWASGTPTVVTIQSKLGALNLAAGLGSDHTTAEQLIQIHLPFAHQSFGALSRGNILRNSFRWPLGGRQSSFNQFVLVYDDAVQDFQETEVRENDYAHQAKINKVSKLEIDGACVDNYHQADRLLQAARFKYRDGDFLCSWGSAGIALLLEEGDYVCVDHDAMPGRRNLPLRLEEVRVSQDHRVSLTGRLYADAQHPQSATPKTVPLTTGVGWPTAAPGAATGLTLTQPANGTVRGTFAFASFDGNQYARVEADKPGGGVDFVDMGLLLRPDSSGNGAFELAGLPAGATDIRVVSINQFSPTATSTSGTESITVNAAFALAAEETDGTPQITLVDKFIFHKDSLTDLGSADAKYTPVIALEYVIDGGGVAIVAGHKGHLEVPIDCEILQWTLVADQSGSIVIDIWKDTYANFPPTVADSITAAAKPTLSSQQKNQDSTLSGWTTTITTGDLLAFNVDSATTVQRVTLSLKCRRT